MRTANRTPWDPEPRLVDPLLAMMALLCLALGTWILTGRDPRPAPERASLPGRLAELLTDHPSLAQRAEALAPPPATDRWDWDRGVRSVLQAEAAPPQGIPALPAGADPGFRKAWEAAYSQHEPLPGPEERRTLRTQLGDGAAARLLEARLRAREGGDPGPIRQEAAAWRTVRIRLLLAGLTAVGLLLLVGLPALLWLAFTPRRSPIETFAPSSYPSLRGLLLAFLPWMLAFLLAGTAVTLLTILLPPLKPLGLGLAYSLHAAFGILLAARARGQRPADFLAALYPRPTGTDLLQGTGFLAAAALGVVALSVLLGPLLPAGDPPQRHILEQLASSPSHLVLALNVLVIVLLAPFFEEALFRGFLLSSLAARFGPGPALALSSLAFGLIHPQPRGWPTLVLLGLVLGWSRLRTGRLWPAALVHAAWNGGVLALGWALFG